MNASDLWHATLKELQGQMTKATFDTWVRPTRAIDCAGNVLRVGVHSPYAKEWLESRLLATIERTVNGIADTKTQIVFVQYNECVTPPADCPANAETPEHAGDVIVTVIDSPLVPYIQVQKYAISFWQPIIGCIPFATWNMLRTMDKQNDGSGKRHKISVEIIAATLDVHRQQITGRPIKSHWQPGAFDILNQEHLAKIESIKQKGDPTGHGTIWWARVLNSAPFLTPAQHAKLPLLLAERHDRFIAEFGDAAQWEQISLPTLADIK